MRKTSCFSPSFSDNVAHALSAYRASVTFGHCLLRKIARQPDSRLQGLHVYSYVQSDFLSACTGSSLKQQNHYVHQAYSTSGLHRQYNFYSLLHAGQEYSGQQKVHALSNPDTYPVPNISLISSAYFLCQGLFATCHEYIFKYSRNNGIKHKFILGFVNNTTLSHGSKQLATHLLHRVCIYVILFLLSGDIEKSALCISLLLQY